MKKHTLSNALVNAGATAAYVLLVVAFIFNSETLFGGREPEDALLIPVVMLLLFVISASITGFLVLGKPILWYLDGKKKEAVALFLYTIGFLALITVAFALIVI